nr:PREDICTED: neuronal pentraxin-2-like [Pelecanus crispus]
MALNGPAHQLRANVSYAALPNDLREMLQRRLGDLERQLLSKVAELEDEKSLLHNETSAHRQRTETALNALLERVSELEKGNSAFKSPDEFKVSLPLRTNYLYGKIKKTLPELYAFTVCLWLRSSASPGIGTPFSYAVPGQANEIVLIEWGNNPIELLINDKVAQLPLFISDGKWHHICITWTTRDGMWEAFQDGEKLGTGENLAPWHPIKPGGVLILGQEQDTVGGRFDATQAFVGEMSQFNIWDRVLKAEDIVNIANCSTNMPGNIIPWVDNNVDVFGGATKWPVETCAMVNLPWPLACVATSLRVDAVYRFKLRLSEDWADVLAKLQIQKLPDGLPLREIVLFIKDALAFHPRWLPAHVCPSSLAPSGAVPRCSCRVKDAEQSPLRYPRVPLLAVSLYGITGSGASLAKGRLKRLWHGVCFSFVLKEFRPSLQITKLFPPVVLECLLRIRIQKGN